MKQVTCFYGLNIRTLNNYLIMLCSMHLTMPWYTTEIPLTRMNISSPYSTVTLFARFLGLSTSKPFATER